MSVFTIHIEERYLTVTNITCNTRYMSSRKEELLRGVLAYLLQNGTASLSLRPLALAIGTSPRMLLFHFKSKEGLLRDVMQELSQRLQRKLEDLTHSQSRQTKDPLSLFWQWATRKDVLPYFRLLYEAQMVAMLNPEEYAPILKEASIEWRKLALRSMSLPLRDPALVDLCIAVCDGLLLECIISGDRRRLTSALNCFLSLLPV